MVKLFQKLEYSFVFLFLIHVNTKLGVGEKSSVLVLSLICKFSILLMMFGLVAYSL